MCTHSLTRSEEHTSELQSHLNLVCRLLLEKKTQSEWQLRTHGHSDIDCALGVHSRGAAPHRATRAARGAARSRNSCHHSSLSVFLNVPGSTEYYSLSIRGPFRF